MGDFVSALFGGQTKAQKQQAALLKQQQDEQNAVEAGQETLRNGGGQGLLSYTGPQSTTSLSGAAAGDAISGLKGLNRLLSGSA